jgi:Fis family transcriptional regulator
MRARQPGRLLPDLRGTEPDGMYDMLVKVVEKPLLEVVMARPTTTSPSCRVAGPEPQHPAQEAVEHKLLMKSRQPPHERTS